MRYVEISFRGLYSECEYYEGLEERQEDFLEIKLEEMSLEYEKYFQRQNVKKRENIFCSGKDNMEGIRRENLWDSLVLVAVCLVVDVECSC